MIDLRYVYTYHQDRDPHVSRWIENLLPFFHRSDHDEVFGLHDPCLALSVATAFQSSPVAFRPTTALAAESEVSRRVALVTAAAVAAGSITSPAQAATLARTVAAIEKKNIAEVNTKGAPEKHIPQVTVEGSTVEVVIPHVMDPIKPHFIEYVWLQDTKSGKVVAVNAFSATDASPPKLTATVSGATLKPLAYCNLHGLWQGDEISV